MEREELLELRKRIICGATAMGIAIFSSTALEPDTAYACEPSHEIESPCDCQLDDFEPIEVKKPKSKYGVYVDPETNIEYNTVIAEQGDTASKLSSRAIHYYMEYGDVPADYREKYNDDYDTRAECWPVMVFLNTQEGKKYHTVVGKKYIFPKTFDEMIMLKNKLAEIGWTARYIQNNKIYPKPTICRVPLREVTKLIQDIYREKYNCPNLVVDKEMVKAYLKAHNNDFETFVLDNNSKLNQKEKESLTQYIPTISELEAYMPKNKNPKPKSNKPNGKKKVKKKGK